MHAKRFTMKALATLTLWAGFGLTGFAQPPAITVQQAFETRPRQPGIAVATPTPDQMARHKVEPIKGKDQTTIGYVVRDAEGRTARQFVSYDGKNFNIVAYYVNGQESYRETYRPEPTLPYEFRWLGPNGGKWGLDHDRDGKIDEWFAISPEEASQELLAAVATRDAKRLEALLPTEDRLKGIGLAPAEIARIKEKSAGAVKKLTEAAAALKLTADAKWIHLELGVPQTTPADAFGGRDDHVVHKNGTILISDGKETKLLQTGEMILVGRSWKLVEGPAAGPAGQDSVPLGGAGEPLVTPETKELVEQLDALDKQFGMAGVAPDKMAEYYTKRAGIIEQIVQKLKPEQQTGWAKLLVDSLASAAELGSDGSPTHVRLKQLKDAFAAAPQNPLGPYAAFRLITAENGIAMAKATGATINAVQEKYRDALEKFVGAYPKSEDAPEAVMRLSMSFEFAGGKDGDAKAKQWCDTLIKNYAGHHHAARAAGMIKRLECEGKPLELAGISMATGQPFNAVQLNGKAVVVFYWASWSDSLAADVKKLKELATTYGPKGLEIIAVALDDDAKTAGDAINKNGIPGTHLHQAGGLDRSPLATNYGILVAPHLFVVGKDGKIVKKAGDMATLEDDVKKLTMP